MGEIDIKQFKKEYKKQYKLIDKVLAKEGVNLNNLNSMTPEQLTSAFNELISIPNLIALLDDKAGLLEPINGEADTETRIMNKKKLCEIYPHSLEMSLFLNCMWNIQCHLRP